MELTHDTFENKFVGTYNGCEVEIFQYGNEFWPTVWSDKEEAMFDSGDKQFGTLKEAEDWIKRNVDNNFIAFED